MNLIRALFLLLIVHISCFSQDISKGAILEDYQIFKNILIEAHPGLFEYTPKTEWDSLFKKFEAEDIDSIEGINALFKSLSALVGHAHDGHLNVLHPKMSTVPSMFPLWIKVIGNKLYLDVEDFDIPVGSEILKINDLASSAIIKALMKYTTSDGYNLTRKYRQIESEFSIFHFYEFGRQENYKIEYISPNGTQKTMKILPKPLETIGKQSVKRKSYFADYHGYKDKELYFKERIAEKWPFLYFDDDLNLAVLTVHSFALDPKAFKSRLIELFKNIKRKKSENLVIDIRQNDGGYRINAIHLYSFLAKRQFKQRTLESVLVNQLPLKEHIVHTPSDFSKFFEMYFEKGKEEHGRWVITEDPAQGEMVPAKSTFIGEVYILTSGKTFSAGTEFAINAKNDRDITLVGEETGGGYYFHTGQFPVVYELPNSKILIRISLLKIDHYVVDETFPKGSGVLPDVTANLTVYDLIHGTDTQLEYIIDTLKKDQ